MKVEKCYHVRCKFCNTPSSIGGYEETREEAIRVARQHRGYSTLKGHNICSDCRDEYEEDKELFLQKYNIG